MWHLFKILQTERSLDTTYQSLSRKHHYQCALCQISYKTIGNLAARMAVHASYPCTTCWRYFGEKTDLAKHIRVHKGERPYQCGTCDKSFKQSCSLSYHIKSHSKEKRLYSCLLCSESFQTSSYLSFHVKTHSTYKCSMCGKALKTKICLARHLLSHHHHTCVTCKKSFSTTDHLSKHITIHKEVAQFASSLRKSDNGQSIPTLSTTDSNGHSSSSSLTTDENGLPISSSTWNKASLPGLHCSENPFTIKVKLEEDLND